MNNSWIFLRSITTVYAIVIYIYTVRIYDIHVYIYTHVCISIYIHMYVYIYRHYIHYMDITYHICIFWYVIYNVVMIWLLPICRDTQGAKSRWKFQYSLLLGWSSCELQSNAAILMEKWIIYGKSDTITYPIRWIIHQLVIFYGWTIMEKWWICNGCLVGFNSDKLGRWSTLE